MSKKTEFKRAKVRQKVTSDLILDLYEQALEEEDDEKKETMLATVEVLSENLNTYLVTTEEDE